MARLESHRWRYVGNRVVTVTPAHEVIGCANILLAAHRDVKVYYRDRNTSNLQRYNLTYRQTVRANDFQIQGDTALLLIGEYTVYCDTADVPKLQEHSWQVTRKRNGFFISASVRLPHGIRQIRMSRYLLGLDHQDTRYIIFKNGDVLDHRKDNLRITR